jgi:hypothetical protein
MIQRYAICDAHGHVTAYVLKETSHHPAVFSHAPQPCESASPLVDAVCMLVGLIMLAATGLLLWVMAAAA